MFTHHCAFKTDGSITGVIQLNCRSAGLLGFSNTNPTRIREKKAAFACRIEFQICVYSNTNYKIARDNSLFSDELMKLRLMRLELIEDSSGNSLITNNHAYKLTTLDVQKVNNLYKP